MSRLSLQYIPRLSLASRWLRKATPRPIPHPIQNTSIILRAKSFDFSIEIGVLVHRPQSLQDIFIVTVTYCLFELKSSLSTKGSQHCMSLATLNFILMISLKWWTPITLTWIWPRLIRAKTHCFVLCCCCCCCCFFVFVLNKSVKIKF